MRTEEDIEQYIGEMEASRICAADYARKLVDLEAERITLRVAIYDRFRATGKTQKDSEDAARTDPDYQSLQATIGGTEHAKELQLAAAETARLRAKLGIALIATRSTIEV
jgi:hypothetical protein